MSQRTVSWGTGDWSIPVYLMRNITLREPSQVNQQVISHFQSHGFLAHYDAMCPSNASAANPEPKSTLLPDSVLDEQKKTQLPPAAPSITEVGGREGPDPTRYGDWEKAGRCIDF